ncbi:hypothetical protein [Nocardiopsis protaetiae]|uniref:hypothetical protein n=1 Tax=Nocardiopsis protaetiae TaxID=3382270 RepID=UPI00387B29BF
MSRKRKRPQGRPGGRYPAPPRPAWRVLREEWRELSGPLLSRPLAAFGGLALLLAVMFGFVVYFFMGWAGRWFAVVPRPARVVSVLNGNPVVLIDTGGGEPVRAVAHGTYTTGEPLDVIVRHAPFAPEVAVMGDHVPPALIAALAALACGVVLAVWSPKGLRASWRRRRRTHPRKGRVEGAELWVPVLLRAVPAAVLLAVGALAGAAGAILGAVTVPEFSAGSIALLTVFFMAVSAGFGLGVNALFHYAGHAPVTVRSPVRGRTLPRWGVQSSKATVLLIVIVGLIGPIMWKEHSGWWFATSTVAGTAVVDEVWTTSNRGGGCEGWAAAVYTAGDLSYRTTLDVSCAEAEALRRVDTIPVEWSDTAPEYVRWVR